jgi:hypothetical protein
MNIEQFGKELAQTLQKQMPRSTLASESAFEREHVVEPAWELSRKYPEIRVFAHRSKQRNRRCVHRKHCGGLEPDFALRVKGCPRCWSNSKAGSVVDAFMTRSNFDLVAIDERANRLAVEVKWLAVSAGRGPNAELQRFIGQCVLARATHKVVLGVCGLRGQRKKQFDQHEAKVKAYLKKMGVIIIALNARVQRGRH